MLDPRMTYTCGYWKEADNLNDAQEAKLDLICRKVGLKPGMRVLDLGCGWGSFAGFAAERYGVEVVGVTVSKAAVQSLSYSPVDRLRLAASRSCTDWKLALVI